MRTDLTDITMVIDRSGSMQSIRTDAEGGINSFIEQQKQEPGEANLTLVQFDTEYEFVHSGVPIKQVPAFKLIPRGSTALLDAVGRAINETGARLAAVAESQRPGLVVFVIVTDGQENSSREFTRDQIRTMVEHQQSAYKWQFTFLAANQDAFAAGGSMGIAQDGIAKRVGDVRVLQLIRAFLNAGVLENGLVTATDEGTPQGGPLSPWLSNVMLDDLDRELERRGLKFARYADDCNIYVRSPRTGQRVMASVSRFLMERLRLTVNSSKSAVDRPWNRKFLGYSFTNHRAPKRRIAPKAIQRFKDRIRELTRRTRGISLEEMTGQLNSYLRGWLGYFGRCDTPSVLRDLNSWLHRRLRAVVWKQWKTSRRRFSELRCPGVSRDLAAQTVGSCHGPWRLSKSPALHKALSTQFFQTLGLATLLPAAPAA